MSYTPVAERLVDEALASQSSSLVKVDHIAFSFKLHDLRHCRTADLSSKSRIGRIKAVQSFFPLTPVFRAVIPSGTHDEGLKAIEKQRQTQLKVLSNYYEKALKIFVYYALGFELGSPRFKGFHGYSNSMSLYKDGEEIGFVGIGGQQDTCYIQISGTGCKHLFNHATVFELHHWLDILCVTKFTRLDLARDCFDDNFNSDYAMLAYSDGAFRTGSGGVLAEDLLLRKGRGFGKNRVLSMDMYQVGGRENPIYWRIYDKRLEQKIDAKYDSNGNIENHWWRNEVELKKWPVDAILNVESAFAGICEFSASMCNSVGIRTRAMTKAKEKCLDVAAKLKWVRHACAKRISELLELTNHNCEDAMALLLPQKYGGKHDLQDAYQQLINYSMRE